ncbi:MAG: hypothetical protein JNM27_04520 [Leptospirales bacterium]|nr:hypothetical protein [Leptospirales bacterium]
MASISEVPDDLAIITSYYNPQHYVSRRENFHCFARFLGQAARNLFVVESAFESDDFELSEFPGLSRIRGGDVLWQKERILNLAMRSLPEKFKKIAWVDCDLLFANPLWMKQASDALNEFPVIQLFDTIVRLPSEISKQFRRGTIQPNKLDSDHDEVWKGFAAIQRENPQKMLSGDFAAHGHTGFAWGIRREIVQDLGFYDACIAGSGDHMMAHAFCGDWDSICIDRIIEKSSPHRVHFEQWCKRIYPRVRSRIGLVPGTIYHLWHGETLARRYVLRNRELAALGFDPRRDIHVGPSGLWEWTGRNDRLRHWAIDYFKQRNEDGEAQSA